MDTAGTACIGIELENFTYRETPGGYVPVALYGKHSLVEALLDVSRTIGGKAIYHHGNGAPVVKAIEFPDGCRFLFEPGGQVEISTTPCNTIGSLDLQLRSMQDILSTVTHERHIRFGQQGTNPLFRGDQLSNQIPLPRYIALEKYFNAIGPYGRQMMLQTCGLHINMDAGFSDDVRIKRIVAANLLVPFATALFANSTVVGGENTGYQSYRSHIWQHADPYRTGILPVHRILESMDREELVSLYLDFGLKAPLIFIQELGDKTLPPSCTMEYWLDHPIEGTRPALHHLENHFSLLFPEVRLKGYLELRTVDAPPVKWQMVPVLFYAGLLYGDQTLDKTLELLSPYAADINRLYEESRFGPASDLLFNLSLRLVKIAMDGLSGLTGGFAGEQHVEQLQSFVENFTVKRKSFAG